jgi:hypothetical protein
MHTTPVPEAAPYCIWTTHLTVDSVYNIIGRVYLTNINFGKRPG